MAIEDLGKAVIPQSSSDCFAPDKVGGSGRVQDTGVPANGTNTPLMPPDESMLYLNATREESQISKVLDSLRKLKLDEGLNGHSLPQIIVVGTQSSGKSSVLEAITGVPFARKSGTCTRYKTRVTVQRGPADAAKSVVLGIDTDKSRRNEEILLLENFRINLTGPDWEVKLTDAMQEADNLIFDNIPIEERTTWKKDVLCVTMTGPKNQNLELFDLPGLITVEGAVEAGSIELVKQMVVNEMVKPNSIVLAVVKATSDISTQDILQLCRTLDVEPRRTLAVLTMPDRASSQEAANYMRIVNGQHAQLPESLGLDWHVLRNRREDELGISTSDRDLEELSFFTTTPSWSQLRHEDRGIEALRNRLTTLLFSSAKKELPKLFEELEARKNTLNAELAGLGEYLTDAQLKKGFKLATIRLHDKSQDHSRGIFESDILEHDGPHCVYLRSRIIDQSELFRDRVLEYGHKWDLIGRQPSIDLDEDLRSIYKHTPAQGEPQPVSVEEKKEDDVLKHLTELLNTMRNQGIPGFNNQDIINKEFWRLSKLWKPIAEQHIDNVFRKCLVYFNFITPLASASPENSLPDTITGFGNNSLVGLRYREKFLVRELEERRRQARVELNNLEADRLDACQNLDRDFLIKFRKERERRARNEGAGAEFGNTCDY